MEPASVAPEVSPEQRKRGRPRLLSPRLESGIAGSHQTRTRRTTLGRYYMERAIRILFDLSDGEGFLPREPEFAFFLTPDPRRLRMTMLSELGRISDDDMLRSVARIVARSGRPTAQAVALIRRIRLGDRDPYPDRLTDSILAAIDAHRARYPSTSPAQVLVAIEEAAGVFRRALPAPADDDVGL